MNSKHAAGAADTAGTAQESREECARNRGRDAGLDSKYGAIGISAVAAAVRYQSETKSTDNAPAASQPASPWLADLAA